MPNENLIIRLARSEDILDIYAMVCDLENTKLDRDGFKSTFQRNLKADSIIYLIAIIDSVAVGFLSCHGSYLLHHEGQVFEIQEMYIDPGFRNKEIGTNLLNHLRQILKQRNVELLEVCSNIKRESAHQFYLKNGFDQSHFKFTHLLR